MTEKIEVRVLDEPINVEWRADDGGDKEAIVEGYAAKFDVRSIDMGGFRERIAPGAFRDVLRSPETDVRATFNHDFNIVLGRQGAKTLELREDKTGLFYRLKMPNTTQARDLVTSMERGDIAHSSFMFIAGKTSWENVQHEGRSIELRNIHSVARLLDVTIATMPIYLDADAKVLKRMMDVTAALEERAEMQSETRKRKAAQARRIAIAEFGDF